VKSFLKEGPCKVGVFICHCGSNIAGTVDVEELARSARKLPDVTFSTHYVYMCSDPGQELIKQNIRKHDLNRIVVAACSPRMHEETFRKAVSEAGINPYVLEIANIREHCSWVHMNQKKEATEKAKALVGAAVMKSRLDEPLEPLKIEVEKSALVVGAGIAGIQSSFDLAEQGFEVYLVEKSPSIGGHMAQLDKTFPTLDCSSCILTPKMVDVSKHEKISLLTYSEVKSVEGYVGNFEATVLKKPRYVREDLCKACGICAQKCPVKVPNEFDLGLGERKAIYVPFPQAVPLKYTIDSAHCLFHTKMVCRICERFCPEKAIDLEQKPEEVKLRVGAIIIATGYDLYDCSQKFEYGYGKYRNIVSNLEFERLVSASGPTSGKIVRPSDHKPPAKIAFIQCVGSRDVNSNKYCSRICCMASLKQAHQTKEKYPNAETVIFYTDLRCFGKGYEEFLERVQSEGTRLVRGRVAEIYGLGSGNLRLRYENTLLGEIFEEEFDLVVLAAGLVPSKNEDLRSLLKLSTSPDGFLAEAHPKLKPVETFTNGIYICGVAQGPKDIPDTVAQAGAAASRASSLLTKGSVSIEPITAEVDQELCSGCGICKQACFYGAIELEIVEGKKRAKTNPFSCKGCGVCSAACPSGAIVMKHFTDNQIKAEIKAILS
jgi:heterodisulfide reductase subunit A